MYWCHGEWLASRHTLYMESRGLDPTPGIRDFGAVFEGCGAENRRLVVSDSTSCLPKATQQCELLGEIKSPGPDLPGCNRAGSPRILPALFILVSSGHASCWTSSGLVSRKQHRAAFLAGDYRANSPEVRFISISPKRVYFREQHHQILRDRYRPRLAESHLSRSLLTRRLVFGPCLPVSVERRASLKVPHIGQHAGH